MMRKPKVKNKYNLTYKDLSRLKVLNRDKICEPLFWRNNVIDAWCIIKKTADHGFGDESSFWLGVYNEDAKTYKGKVRISFDRYGGMCSYKFKKFFDYQEIENELDLEIQEISISTINYLLDEKILSLERK